MIAASVAPRSPGLAASAIEVDLGIRIAAIQSQIDEWSRKHDSVERQMQALLDWHNKLQRSLADNAKRMNELSCVA